MKLLLCFILVLTCFSTTAQGSGNTLSFNGNNEFVDIGDQVANGCRTIELWFKPGQNITSSLSEPKSLIMRDYSNSSGLNTNEFGLAFYPGSWGLGGKLVFIRRVGTTLYEVASNSNSWQAGHWYHVCGTIDPSGGMRLFINGVLQNDTDPTTSPIGTQTGTVWDKVSIGRWGNLNIRYFNGEIDEVRLWQTVRSQQEVREKMCSSLIGNEPGLRAYYTFDSFSGSTLIDDSQNSYNGILQPATNNNWTYSGAPIGDTSTFTYPGNLTGVSLILNAGIGDNLTVDNINSSAVGVQIYKVNSLPNVTTNISSPTTSNYYGVFLTSTNGTYNLSYDYSSYACSNCDEIYSRNDNAEMNWLNLGVNSQNCQFDLMNESSIGYDYRAEYIVSSGSVPIGFLGNDTLLCSGSNLNLDPQQPNSTFVWHDNSTGPNFTVTQPGTYWVEVTSSCGMYSDTIIVDYDAPLNVDLGNDTLLCQSNTFVLDPGVLSSPLTWQDGTINPTYDVFQSGVYHVTTSNVCGVATDTIEVIYGTPPSIDLGQDTTICQNTSLTLDASTTQAIYTWQDGTSNSFHIANQPGLYWVTVSNLCGTDSDSLNLQVAPLPYVSLGNDTTLCSGNSITIDISGTGSNYQWQDGSTDSLYLVSQQGLYHVTVDNYCGSSSDSVFIDFLDEPSITLGADTVICEGEFIQLTISSSATSYFWQDGSTNNFFITDQPGTYWVVASNYCGTDSDSIQINVTPVPEINLGSDTVICQGQTFVLDPGNTGWNYEWQDGSTNQTFPVVASGVYSVFISQNNCYNSDTIQVEILTKPQIDLGEDTLICEGKQLVLGPSGSGVYTWNTGSSETSIVANSFGEYWVNVSNICGSDADTINIGDKNCNCALYLPNTFTPDGDEHNQNFKLLYECDIYKFIFRIYNRWGEMIYFSYDPNDIWDGTYNGYLAQDGTYVYDLLVETVEGEFYKLNGHINILR